MRIRVISGRKCIGLLTILVFLFVTTFVYTKVRAKEQEGIKVPIIMYHSILKSKNGTFIISPESLENDFKYIKEQGYTTITIADLVDYVYNDGELPEKPIIITFDDGYYNNYTYVFPLLEKYDMKAIISIIGVYTDTFSKANEANANYGHFRWSDICELIEDGKVEFQNHTYNLHTQSKGRNGTMKKYNESIEEYTKVLTKDLMKLQNLFKENCAYTPLAFTYPFGAVSKESTNILKKAGFKASFISYEGINYITKDPNCLFLLKRYNRKNTYQTESFFNKIFKQIDN